MSQYDKQIDMIDEKIEADRQRIAELEEARNDVPWTDHEVNQWRREVRKEVLRLRIEYDDAFYRMERELHRQLFDLKDTLGPKLNWLLFLALMTWAASFTTLLFLLTLPHH